MEILCKNNGISMFITEVDVLGKKELTKVNPPSHKKVIDYYMNTDGYEEFLGWWVFDNVAECSLGEYFCWGCGLPVSKLNYLEKAHIVPKALGGKVEPSNFFLLCKGCHEESPDTGIPEIFFKWLKGKGSYITEGIRELQVIAEDYIIDSIDITDILKAYKDLPTSTHGVSTSRYTRLLSFDYILSQRYERKE